MLSQRNLRNLAANYTCRAANVRVKPVTAPTAEIRVTGNDEEWGN